MSPLFICAYNKFETVKLRGATADLCPYVSTYCFFKLVSILLAIAPHSGPEYMTKMNT